MGCPPILLKSSDQRIVEAPPRGGATIGRRFLVAIDSTSNPVRGGKSARGRPEPRRILQAGEAVRQIALDANGPTV